MLFRSNTVFQRYALFAHLNIYNNIAFGLKLKKIPYDALVVDKEKINSNNESIKSLKYKIKNDNTGLGEDDKKEIAKTIASLEKENAELKTNPSKTETKFRHFTKKEIEEKVKYALKIVDLEVFEKRDISTLSGQKYSI